ncbi:MAG: hypothetical protein ACTSPS_13480 [Promethearchaeota archaeon]
MIEIMFQANQPQYPLLRLIIWLVFMVIYIYVSQYIYKDAVKKKLNAEIWLLIVMLVPIASWIVYFIVRNVKARETEE